MAQRSPRARKPSAPPDEATAEIRAALRAHEASDERARLSAIDALIDRRYRDLGQAAEAEESPHGSTIRFVGPAEKG